MEGQNMPTNTKYSTPYQSKICGLISCLLLQIPTYFNNKEAEFVSVCLLYTVQSTEYKCRYGYGTLATCKLILSESNQ